jgi:hypothetical protein
LATEGGLKGVRLATLFSPEHGIRGTEDRTNLASGIDQRSGLVVHSLYTVTTIAPPDGTLRGLGVRGGTMPWRRDGDRWRRYSSIGNVLQAATRRSPASAAGAASHRSRSRSCIP